jgi:hypothetical protein
VLILTVGGAVYQAVASHNAQRSFLPPGQLIDVGGYRLHLYCEGLGAPTVILDSSNVGFVADWARIQPQLAQQTRVCGYDRAGMGWSDPSPEPQDARQNAEALHLLLDKAGESGPYVLVGHSFGGPVHADLRGIVEAVRQEMIGKLGHALTTAAR